MVTIRRQQDYAQMGGRRNPYLESYEKARKTESIKQQSHSRGSDETALSVSRRRRAMQIRNKRRRRIIRLRLLFGLLCFGSAVWLLTVVVGFFAKPQIDGTIAPGKVAGVFEETWGDEVQGINREVYAKHPRWEEQLLTLNEYSRPGEALEEVKNIFVHYTANPGTSAAQNRSYFEQLKDTHERSASAHFIIGYEGEIIQCIPLDEIGYAVQTRNYDSISIECCYLADDGSFTQETYDSLLALLKWLMEAYSLDAEDILRHYDCGGKKCPLYYTEHEDAWERLKKEVREL